MSQTVTFVGGATPPWQTVRELLEQRGFPVQPRMIDGQLAFPDEVPPDDWKELRLGTPQGMVTLRREVNTVEFVTWGNADVGLQQAWNALVWAFAEAGTGRVQMPQGAVDADTYRKQVEMPSALLT